MKGVGIMKKRFVLDTNILLQDPTALLGFSDNDVILTSTVLQELDEYKNARGELGHHARGAIRLIEEARAGGDLTKGVKLQSGGVLYVEPNGVHGDYLPNGFSISVPDNKIIATCIYLTNKEPSNHAPVILVSNDIAMRINASVILGPAHVQEYKNLVVNQDHSFTGYTDLEVPYEAITSIYQNGSWVGKAAGKKNQWNDSLTENLFVTARAIDPEGNEKTALTVYREGALRRIDEKKTLFGGVTPKNALQRYAIWALTNPEIPLVILSGPAGTAKTFLSLAAGLEQTYTSQRVRDRLYQKILISRPNAEAGDPGFGYLPGSLHEKMTPLLLPFYDNLENLLARNDEEMTRTQIDDLFASGVIEMCALSYIRGRSLTKSYLICDEAQNASQLLIRDIITRAGQGTKIILAGDPEQCDSLNLDSHNNGLVYAMERFRDDPLAAIIRFSDEQSVRSALAKDALSRMNSL